MKKILLVDDNASVLNAISLMLDKDYRTITAASGLIALNIISQQSPDLILMDINIPDIDGVTISEILHKNDKWKNIPVIIISGYEKPSKIMPENVKGFLGKPVRSEDVKHAIRQYC